MVLNYITEHDYFIYLTNKITALLDVHKICYKLNKLKLKNQLNILKSSYGITSKKYLSIYLTHFYLTDQNEYIVNTKFKL